MVPAADSTLPEKKKKRKLFGGAAPAFQWDPILNVRDMSYGSLTSAERRRCHPDLPLASQECALCCHDPSCRVLGVKPPAVLALMMMLMYSMDQVSGVVPAEKRTESATGVKPSPTTPHSVEAGTRA